MTPSLIHEQLERVAVIAGQVEEKFFENAHKRDREWWTLGNVVELLAQTNDAHPTHARATEPPNPDFVTYLAEGTVFKSIEIAEVLRPGRKRHEEMKQTFASESCSPRTIYPADDAFSSFRDVLLSKFEKRYGAECWLVLMHSMMIYEFPGRWALGWAAKLKEEYDNWQNVGSPVRISESPYERILAWNPSTLELIELFPEWSIIHSQHNPA